MNLPSTFMLGLRWLCMHYDWTSSTGLLISKKKEKIVKFYVQSLWRVVLLWYHRFWQSSVWRGRHTKLCIISSLKRIIQICFNFTVGFLKLRSTHPIHIVVWGNVPFKFRYSGWRKVAFRMAPLFLYYEYAVKVRRHTPWSRVRCHGSHECWFTHSQFHSRRHSLCITLKYTTFVCMRSSNAWTSKAWQRSEWRVGFNSV